MDTTRPAMGLAAGALAIALRQPGFPWPIRAGETLVERPESEGLSQVVLGPSPLREATPCRSDREEALRNSRARTVSGRPFRLGPTRSPLASLRSKPSDQREGPDGPKSGPTDDPISTPTQSRRTFPP